MIELRWVEFGPNKELNYRVMMPSVDASGALCPGSQWSDWKKVPTVTGDEVSLQDLIASGGFADAP